MKQLARVRIKDKSLPVGKRRKWQRILSKRLGPHLLKHYAKLEADRILNG